MSFRVVLSPGPPAGSTGIAHGDVALDAPTPPPGMVSSTYRFVPFETRAAGQVDITVDWVSPTDGVSFAVFLSPCTAIGSCGDIVGGFNYPTGVEPISGSAVLTAGQYTMRIDNSGPGAETAHYEIRLTPK